MKWSINLIKLKNFTALNTEEIALILQWRNHSDTSRFMKNKKIGFKEHRDFIEKLKENKTKKYFLVFKDKKAIGVIDFINISEKSCEFGLYSRPNLKGMGQILMDTVKKYAFTTLNVQIVKAYVFKENEKALKLYKRNDFAIIKEDEEFYYMQLNKSECKALFE